MHLSTTTNEISISQDLAGETCHANNPKYQVISPGKAIFLSESQIFQASHGRSINSHLKNLRTLSSPLLITGSAIMLSNEDYSVALMTGVIGAAMLASNYRNRSEASQAERQSVLSIANWKTVGLATAIIGGMALLASASRHDPQVYAELVKRMPKDLNELGKYVPNETVENLGAVVQHRVNFKKEKGAEAPIFLAHMAEILKRGALDEYINSIAKMGMIIAMENGLIPMGKVSEKEHKEMIRRTFEPLYKLFKDSGFNAEGVKIHPEVFENRGRLMEKQKDEFAEIANELEKISFLSLFVKYYEEFSNSKKIADKPFLEGSSENMNLKSLEPPKKHEE